MLGEITLYKLGYDAQVAQDPKLTITAGDIIKEAIEMAQYINITPTEKIWLSRMNRRELIPSENLDGFLYNSSESEVKGILDTYYQQITSIKSDLNKATQYYISSENVGNLLFPLPDELKKLIDSRYINFAQRAERMALDFDGAVMEAEKLISPKLLNITYRFDENNEKLYSPDLIQGADSVLVDHRLSKGLKATLSDFHLVKTMSFFKKKEGVK